MDGNGNRGSNEMERIQQGLEAFLEKEIEVIDVKNRTAAERVPGLGNSNLQKEVHGLGSGNLAGEFLEWEMEEGASGEKEEMGELETAERPYDDWDSDEEGADDWDSDIQLWPMHRNRLSGDPASGVRRSRSAKENSAASSMASEASGGNTFKRAASEMRASGNKAAGPRAARQGAAGQGVAKEGMAGPRAARQRAAGQGTAEEGMAGPRAARPRSAGQGVAKEGMAGPRAARQRAAGQGTAEEGMAGPRAAGQRAADQRTGKQKGLGKEIGAKRTRAKKAVGNASEIFPAGEQMEEEMASSRKGSAAKPPKKKGSRLMRKLRRLLIVAVLIIGLLGLGLYQLVGFAYGKMTYREVESMASLPMKEQGVVNILLIGNDSRENGEDGRSDAMILLSISNRTKKIYMTSLLRDIYVEIPGYDNNRLNAAYSFGGAELLMKTIEKNFDIPVHRYMLVNFEAFAGLVDAVGGVDLELTTDEIVFVNGYLSEYNRLTNRPEGTDNMDVNVSGMVHLNGPQALAYSRNRYIGTDFGRTERQRKVLTEVIGKLPKAVLTNAGGLIDGLMSNLTTNLTQSECFRLSLMAGKLLAYEIVSDSIPQPGTYNNATIRNMSVLEVDFPANKKYLKEKIYGE